MTSADRTKTSLLRRTFLATAIALIGFGCAANALADPVDLKVVDRETGQPLKIWSHDGRLFVAGQPGGRYSVRVTNHTNGRVLVVLSVDGVNIISGETAGYDQQGYIFSAHESYDLNGWRKSNTEIAAFTFAPLRNSYAARTDRPADVGVIGMAVFKERAVVPSEDFAEPDYGSYRRDADAAAAAARQASGARSPRAGLASPIPAPPPPPPPPRPAGAAATELAAPSHRAAASAADDTVVTARRLEEKLGTAHGAGEWSVSNVEPFERATPYPQSTRQIEYDTFDNLVASGVIPRRWNGEHRPRPFPTQPDGVGYVPDPPD